MVRCHSKRSLWAAAAAGALILATGTPALAQSATTDTSVSRSVAGQDAKMAAVLDSLKAAGLEQANQRAAEAVQEARVNAAVQPQAQAQASQAPVAGATTGSMIDTLKAAGLVQANQRAAQAVQEARVNADLQAQAQAQAQAPQAPTAGTTTGSMIDTLKAAGRLQANQRAAQAVKEAGGAQAPGTGTTGNPSAVQTTQEALESARVASEEALERAREQAGMNESAERGAPPAFRDALDRARGAVAGDGASRNGGVTVR
jgi:hypothetical protein